MNFQHCISTSNESGMALLPMKPPSTISPP
ncbi:MAG: hypothetical protein K0S79_2817, partial [Nitrospira sp.]|nr:hypothetical protein [Nitrospira sp.]